MKQEVVVSDDSEDEGCADPEQATATLRESMAPAATQHQETTAPSATTRPLETPALSASAGPLQSIPLASVSAEQVDAPAITTSQHDESVAPTATARHQETAAPETARPGETLAPAAATMHQETAAPTPTRPLEATATAAGTTGPEAMGRPGETVSPAAATKHQETAAPRTTTRLETAATSASTGPEATADSASSFGSRVAAVNHFFRAHKTIPAANSTVIKGGFDKLGDATVPELAELMSDLQVNVSDELKTGGAKGTKRASHPATMACEDPTATDLPEPHAAKKPRYLRVDFIPEPGDYIVCQGLTTQVVGVQFEDSKPGDKASAGFRS